MKFNDSALDSFGKFSVVRVDNVRFNNREQTIWFSTKRNKNTTNLQFKNKTDTDYRTL